MMTVVSVVQLVSSFVFFNIYGFVGLVTIELFDIPLSVILVAIAVQKTYY